MRLLHFQLATLKGPTDEGFAVAAEALAVELPPRQRSGWALRRGLCFIEAKQRDAAVADLLMVLALKVNDGHMEQARAALVAAAALPAPRR